MQSENKKWYPIEYAGFWDIQDTNFYESTSVLNADHVGEEQAEENAKLCSAAPVMRELLRDMYLWLEMYSQTRDMDKHHPVLGLVEKYQQLEKEYGI